MELCRWKDHTPTGGFQKANGGCRHRKAEAMSRADFGNLPLVRCSTCRTALGRICPECMRWY